MCTLIAIAGLHPQFPLLIAANRDEYYARPTAPPRLVSERPRALAGVDLEKGGTWLGANEAGIFVGLTNQRGDGQLDPTRASRGEVVVRALGETSVEGIDAQLATLDASRFNGFNLLYGDARALRVAYARPEAAHVEVHPLGAGVWVLPNDRLGSPAFPKVARAEARVLPLLAKEGDALFEGLRSALADHEEPELARVPAPEPGSRFSHALLQRLQALCIHTPTYGTRSATVLALGPGRVERYLYADGPPCTTALTDLTAALRADPG